MTWFNAGGATPKSFKSGLTPAVKAVQYAASQLTTGCEPAGKKKVLDGELQGC